MNKSSVIAELTRLNIDHDPSDSRPVLIELLPKKSGTPNVPIKIKEHVKKFYVNHNYLHKRVSFQGKAIPLNNNTSQKDLKALYNGGHTQKITRK